MIKISVILPVYGVAEYIERCTRSLLAQTLGEMEFLFVDDHGPDDSIAIAQRTVAGHERETQFRFLRPEHNLGAGMARNYAIEQAQGEYIAFVDSDDWVEPDMFESLYERAKQMGGVDLCYGQASMDFLDGSASHLLSNPSVEEGEFTHERKSYFLQNYVAYFWTFIYRRQMIERYALRFPSTRSADDTFFVTLALLVAQTTAHVERPFYHYLIRPGSVVTTRDSKKYLQRLATFRQLIDCARELGVYDTFRPEIDYIYYKKGYISSVMNYVGNSTSTDRNTLRSIRSVLVALVPGYRDNPFFRQHLSMRVIDFALFYLPHISVLLMRWLIRRNKMMA